MKTSAAFVLATCASANPSSCGDGKVPVAGCEKHDFGSCGNACCIIDIAIPNSALEAYNGTKLWLKAGGEDASFTYVTGPGPGGQNPGGCAALASSCRQRCLVR